MKQRKPRKKPERKCPIHGGDCDECSYPWANRVKHNHHKCMSEKMKYLASLSEEKRKQIAEKYKI